MNITTRVILSAAFGFALGFIFKRPVLGLIIGTIAGTIMPVERYVLNPLTYLIAGLLLFVVLNPLFLGVIALVFLAPILLSINLFSPGGNRRSKWNVFDLFGGQYPKEAIMGLLAGFVRESPASKEEQFQMVKRFIRQTVVGFSRQTLWEEFQKQYDQESDVDTLAQKLGEQTSPDQQKFFLQILVSLGRIDEELTQREEDYIRSVTNHLDLSETEVETILEQSRGRRHRRAAGQRRYRQRRRRRGSARHGTGTSLNEAYDVLDLEPSASKKDVKAAYQEKVKEHHPDQFKGDNDERARRAEEKMAEINEAYETIKNRW